MKTYWLLFVILVFFLANLNAQKDKTFIRTQLSRLEVEGDLLAYISPKHQKHRFAADINISYRIFDNFRIGTGIFGTIPHKDCDCFNLQRIEYGESVINGFNMVFLDFGKNNLHYRVGIGGHWNTGGIFSSGIRYYFFDKKTFALFDYRVTAFKYSNYAFGLGYKIK
jgi:hypothetical protein